MRPTNTFTFRGCTVAPEKLSLPILVSYANGQNQMRRIVWRITFPDQTWIRTGTRNTARQYINRYLRENPEIDHEQHRKE